MRRHRGIAIGTSIVLLAAFALAMPLAQAAFAQTSQPDSKETPSTLGPPGKVKFMVPPDSNEELPEPEPVNFMEQVDGDMYLALLGWSSKYRIGLDVQDGDWVKYESVGEGPKETLELRVEKTDAGETWLIEKRTMADSGKSTELHVLFTPGKPKVVSAFRILEDGTREDITPLDDLKAGELFLEARTRALDAVGGDRSKVRVTSCGDVQEISGPYGKLLCNCIEVQVAENVDPISFATRRRWLSEGNLIWLSQDVPRIMPMSAVILPCLLSPDDMMSEQGGMVRSAFHALVDYKGRE
jgi:hypothetical protein